jgi:hypothetical protein
VTFHFDIIYFIIIGSVAQYSRLFGDLSARTWLFGAFGGTGRDDNIPGEREKLLFALPLTKGSFVPYN